MSVRTTAYGTYLILDDKQIFRIYTQPLSHKGELVAHEKCLF